MLRRQALTTVATSAAVRPVRSAEPNRSASAAPAPSRARRRRSGPPAWSWSRSGVPPQNPAATASGGRGSGLVTHLLDRTGHDEPSGHEVGDDHVGLVVRVLHPFEEPGRVVGEGSRIAPATVAPIVRLDIVHTASSYRPWGRRTAHGLGERSIFDGKNMAPNWHTTTRTTRRRRAVLRVGNMPRNCARRPALLGTLDHPGREIGGGDQRRRRQRVGQDARVHTGAAHDPEHVAGAHATEASGEVVGVGLEAQRYEQLVVHVEDRPRSR